ncbi:MAG: methyltransferase domain-containing protein [Aquihabitans sp.]
MPHRQLPPIVDRVDHLVAAARGRRVLHLGCANAPYTLESLTAGVLLHDRIAAVATELSGLDTDSDSIQQLRSRGHDRLVVGDLTELAVDDLPGPFDLIIAGEIIEHVDDPGRFLRALHGLLERDDSTLVLTTINAYGLVRFVQYAWPRRGPLREPVHPDHVAYYSLQTLSLLCRRAGLTVTETAFYDLGDEHRTTTPRRRQRVNDIAVRWWPQLADGIIVHCRPM